MGRDRERIDHRRKARFCKVCFNRIEGEGDVCSPACKRERASQKRRIYDARARNESWTDRRFNHCQVCGVRLTRPGRFCKLHKRERNAEYQRNYRKRKKDGKLTGAS